VDVARSALGPNPLTNDGNRHSAGGSNLFDTEGAGASHGLPDARAQAQVGEQDTKRCAQLGNELTHDSIDCEACRLPERGRDWGSVQGHDHFSLVS
jgi:hypothetical protein